MAITPLWMQQTLAEQLEAWRRVETQRAEEDQRPRVITVSRQAGSGGKLLAAWLAEALGLRYYDRAIIQRVAELAQTDASAVRRRDERSYSSVESLTDSLRSRRTVWAADSKETPDLPFSDYLRHLRAAVAEIAAGAGGVILGRGAHFVLGASRCLRLRVIAPEARRVESFGALLGASPDRARALVTRRDTERRRFVKQAFGADARAAEHYDLVINTDQLTLDDALSTALAAWRTRCGLPTPPAPSSARS